MDPRKPVLVVTLIFCVLCILLFGLVATMLAPRTQSGQPTAYPHNSILITQFVCSNPPVVGTQSYAQGETIWKGLSTGPFPNYQRIYITSASDVEVYVEATNLTPVKDSIFTNPKGWMIRAVLFRNGEQIAEDNKLLFCQ